MGDVQPEPEDGRGSKTYNRFAGQSLDRLAALSDGVFAVALTLLVLDLHVPATDLAQIEQPLWASGAIAQEGQLLSALGKLLPSFITYIMSFLTLGIFWVGQQTQHTHLARSNRDLAWLHLGFLLAVTLLPFSTAFLAAYNTFRVALIIYWLNILLLGVMLYISWRYALRNKLVNDTVTPEVRAAVERRILIAQALYAFGAALCVVSTYLSIAVIVLVQLNYVFAPRIRPLYRL